MLERVDADGVGFRGVDGPLDLTVVDGAFRGGVVELVVEAPVGWGANVEP